MKRGNVRTEACVTRCSVCQQELAIGDWPYCPHGPAYSRNAQSFDPVLVYRDASGHVRFPGRNSGPAPKGYEPVYLRTRREVDRFTQSMNTRERERYFRHKERSEAAFATFLSDARSALRQRMQHMSPAGRALAEAAMRTHDRQPDVNPNFDPGCHFEAFEYDASNRDAQRDRDLARRK